MGSTMPSTIMAEPRAGSYSKEKQRATLVTGEGLHLGIVHDFCRTLERSLKVKSYPPASEVVWFGKRSVSDDRAGIADRNCVILPIPGKFLNTVDHLFGSQRGPGRKFTTLLLSGSEIFTCVPPTSTTSTFTVKPSQIFF